MVPRMCYQRHPNPVARHHRGHRPGVAAGARAEYQLHLAGNRRHRRIPGRLHLGPADYHAPVLRCICHRSCGNHDHCVLCRQGGAHPFAACRCARAHSRGLLGWQKRHVNSMDTTGCCGSIARVFSDVFVGITKMPTGMRRICYLQFATWAAWFAYNPNWPAWMGQYIYGGATQHPGTKSTPQTAAFARYVQWAGTGCWRASRLLAGANNWVDSAKQLHLVSNACALSWSPQLYAWLVYALCMWGASLCSWPPLLAWVFFQRVRCALVPERCCVPSTQLTTATRKLRDGPEPVFGTELCGCCPHGRNGHSASRDEYLPLLDHRPGLWQRPQLGVVHGQPEHLHRVAPALGYAVQRQGACIWGQAEAWVQPDGLSPLHSLRTSSVGTLYSSQEQHGL